MGSSDFSMPILKKLIENFEVVGVVTQPDRPAGRGRLITAPPVKEVAIQHAINLIQPVKMSDSGVLEFLQMKKADFFVVAAYGQILKQHVLDIPNHGSINVHASLLPRWRGASPIQSAILSGDGITGVTTMLMDAGIDTGAILEQQTLSIGEEENASELSNRLAAMGAELIINTIRNYLDGTVKPKPQPLEGITYTRLIKKEDGLITQSDSALHIIRKIRAFYPWPGVTYKWEKGELKVLSAHASHDICREIGKRIVAEKKPAISTPDGALIFDLVQPSGKNKMSAEDFLRGANNWVEITTNNRNRS